MSQTVQRTTAWGRSHRPDRPILPLLAADSPLVKLLVEKARERERIFAGTERGPSTADRLQLDGRHLAYLLNTSFWASLRPEEGHPARGAFTIVDRSVPGGLRFSEPVIVTQESVVRLAPVLGAGLAAVDLSPDDMPQIWGLLEAAPLWQPVIRIVGPAHLVVSQDREVLGLIQGSEAHLVRSGQYSLPNLVASIIDRTDSAPSPDRFAKAEHLFKILASMQRHGQGGTLLVVPAGSRTWPEALSFRYPLDDRSAALPRSRLADLHESLAESAETGSATGLPASPRSTRSRSLLADLSQRLLVQIGQLAAAEGAVVLGDDLSLIGFGATITTPAEDFALSVADAVTGLVAHGRPVSSIVGGDHAGAARFVRHFPDCLGFVVTPDGGVTLFVWGGPDRRLVALTRLRDLLTEY